MRTVMGYRYDCKPRFFSKQSYDEMRKLVEQVLQSGGIAVCICDADITRENVTESQKLKEMKDAYASNDKVVICDSMPSIEFWFLLHYLETNRYFRDSAEVASILRRYLPGFQKHSNFLEKAQWVADLCSDDKLTLAVTRAESISKNLEAQSYSNIFEAIKLFKGENEKLLKL